MKVVMRYETPEDGGKGISALMLERYHLGEVTQKERTLVERTLSGPGPASTLRERLLELDSSDRELLQTYPLERFPALVKGSGPSGKGRRRFVSPRAFLLRRGLAAALALSVLLPGAYVSYRFYFSAGSPDHAGTLGLAGPDRLKGAETKTELSVYLKEGFSSPDSTGQKLPDKAPLREGNTVQLAYVLPPGNEYYGVIFSIDGRSAVTMHYPYGQGQSSLLEAGKRTFLNEAYTLDDAPDFEIFFMVVSRRPLDTSLILKTAGVLAQNPETALRESAGAFKGYEVEALTIRKEP